MVVIGAGNVGIDVASEAFILGAHSVTAIDIQKPAAFGEELKLRKKRVYRLYGQRQFKNMT